MSRRKLEDKNVRKLTRIGNKSIGLTLPIDIVRDLKWKEKQKVTVKFQAVPEAIAGAGFEIRIVRQK